MLGAQIAGGSLLFLYGDLPLHHLEWVHVDISVRAVFSAQPASDAPVLDDHFERIPPPDGAHRTTHHAERIAALAARGSHQILVESQSLANQSRHAVVRIGASAHAGVAAGAAFQIQYQDRKSTRL